MHELIYAAGMTVLHSLWQATLLAGALWLFSRLFTAGANVRYRLAYGILLLQLVASAITFWYHYDPVKGGLIVLAGTIGNLPATLSPGHATSTHILLSTDFWLLLLVAVWLLSVLVGGIRLGFSFGRVRGVRRRSREAVPAAFAARIAELARRLGIEKRVRIGISEALDGPALVGHLRPLLLFPVAIVNQLTTEEAETVILHELAHLRRNDHWWNLLQCIIEVTFYYHPAIHWVAARIRQEREHCCDDLVLRHGPGRLAYARALLYFEEQRTSPQTALSLTDGGGLATRIKRFINNQEIKYKMKSRLFLLPVLALITLVGTATYSPTISSEPPVEECFTPDEVGGNFVKQIGAQEIYPRVQQQIHHQTIPDTLPAGNYQVTTMRDGKTTKLRVEDRQIKELEIDGRVIPPAEFAEHEEMVEGLIGGNRGGNGSSRMFRFDNLNREMPDMPDIPDMGGFSFEFDGESFRGLEDMQERLRQSFEGFGETFGQMFRMEGDSVFSFRFGGDGSLDSLRRGGGGNNFFFRNDDDIDRIYSEEELLRDLQSEERELQALERDIQRLEREKQLKERELELRRGKEKIEGNQEGLRRNQEELRRSNEERMKETRKNSEELRRNSEELRRNNEERLAEIRRNNEERLAEIRQNNEQRLAELEEGPDYGAIVEQLQLEGLLPDEPLRKFVLTDNTLKVNGTKYGQEVYDRFAEVYEERYGQEIQDGTTVKIKKN